MDLEFPIKVIEQQEWLETASEALQLVITKAFEAGGETGQQIKNFLHGSWIGHPLHPALTDVPLGAWTAACILDIMDAASPGNGYAKGADVAVAVGLVGAVGSALTGITDWQSTFGKSRKVGLMHGILNGTATLLYAASYFLRKRSRGTARGLAFTGYAITGTAAFLGGQLVFGDQVGVDHTAAQEMPEKFVPVMAAADLTEGKPTKADANGMPVLLVKQGDTIHAMAETCSHMGGPLSEGDIVDGTIRCPWHCSRFKLENGQVVDGPATFPQPCFETRIRAGTIEVRAARDTAG